VAACGSACCIPASSRPAPDGWTATAASPEYFSDRAWVERWRFSKAPETSGAEPFRVPRFGWRLENYLGGLCAAGLRIVRIAEPRPSAAQCREYPWLARWRRHAARLLLVGARKA
jgi:hypothetical protein